MPAPAELPFARRAGGLLIAIAMFVTGCSGQSASYTPSSTVAETAVHRALEAWRSGLPAGEVPNSKPAIHVTDAGRKPGQTLTDYRILGEARGPSGRTFTVTLQLANPDEEVKTQYVVVGIDPLWVFRQEDFELLMHWDHHMPPAEPSP